MHIINDLSFYQTVNHKWDKWDELLLEKFGDARKFILSYLDFK